MSNKNPRYICTECNTTLLKWLGRCPECLSWDSIAENSGTDEFIDAISNGERLKPIELNSVTESEALGFDTQNKELNRVLGGKLIKGSSVLLGGEPGIGKSTLLLQLSDSISKQGLNVIYISAEESISQISLRAKRLDVVSRPELRFLNNSNVYSILKTIMAEKKIDLFIIDSIQTIINDNISTVPGSVSQVKSVSQKIVDFSKRHNITSFIIGHVTKDGSIAGPKVLEHMVDTVLYFEQTLKNDYRIIRTIKNRFGPTNEIGVFHMQSSGLVGVQNPSCLFISDNRRNSGITIFPALEGTRIVMTEIQSLITSTNATIPRRAILGWDPNRLAMLIAVLYKRYKLNIASKDIYLNIVGGLKIQETSADLPVILSLISSYQNAILDKNCFSFGEVGLSGEIRPTTFLDLRLKEAENLGFKRAIIPKSSGTLPKTSLEITEISHISELNINDFLFDNSNRD